jgi:hypothetical protein
MGDSRVNHLWPRWRQLGERGRTAGGNSLLGITRRKTYVVQKMIEWNTLVYTYDRNDSV